MKLILTLAWRNIWRQPGRSLVLIGAIVSGVWAGVVVSGWANGLIEQRLVNLIQTEITHAQIHHPQFRQERESSMYISAPERIYQMLDSDPRVKSWAPRTLSDGMFQSPVAASGVRIRGVDVELEPKVTIFHEMITQGAYLDETMRNPVLVGEALAEKHNLEPGYRVVLSFQDVNNELVSASFTIAGLYKTHSTVYDERTVYVRMQDLSELINGSLAVHEIAILLEEESYSGNLIADLREQFPDVHSESWYELSPELRYLVDFGGMMTGMIMLIIMFALAFGILNTMLMALFERMRELGMLMAIGMNRQRVFAMILLESVLLTLSGGLAGLLAAAGTIRILMNRGIDLSVFGDGLAEWGFESVIYPVMTGADYGEVFVIVILAAILASIYPALKAVRMNPLEVEKE
ncbi:MAG: ABC transporter permease [Balneolaceae bacterium]|nr:MAG: ABC transporter permease [Balneolaceae bacterium]